MSRVNQRALSLSRNFSVVVVASSIMAGCLLSSSDPANSTAGDSTDVSSEHSTDDSLSTSEGPTSGSEASSMEGDAAAVLSGCVVDLDGRGLPGSLGQFCGPVIDGEEAACLAIRVTADDGCFEYAAIDTNDAAAEGSYKLQFVAGDAAPERMMSANLRRIEVTPGYDVELGVIVLPHVESTIDLTDEGEVAVDIDDDLTLTIDVATTDWALQKPLVGGVRVPPMFWPFDKMADGSEVVAIWAFVPHDAHGEHPYVFEISSRLGLDSGAVVGVYEISKLDSGLLHEVGEFDVDEGGIVSAELGLHELTWMIVVERP